MNWHQQTFFNYTFTAKQITDYNKPTATSQSNNILHVNWTCVQHVERSVTLPGLKVKLVTPTR